MKNVFKLSTLLLVFFIFGQVACNKGTDPAPEPEKPDPTGKWALKSAKLVEPDPLVITNFTTDGQNFMTLEIPAGDTQNTTMLVGGALAGAACQDPNNYAQFHLELTSAGRLLFNCPPENVSEDSGSWSVIKDADGNYTIINLSVNVGDSGIPVQITVENFQMAADGKSFTGTAKGYPMVKDFITPIGPDNIQFLTSDLEFVAVQ